MNKMMRWIDKIPLALIIVLAVLMAIAPVNAESHLLEKCKMLINLTLTKPIDIFDLLMHGTPQIILIIRLSRMVLNQKKS